MQFKERIPVAAPQSTVAGFLSDLPALLACLPICKDIVVPGDGTFRAVAEDRVGPFKARLALSGTVSTGADGSLSVKASGNDPALGSGVALQITLRAEAEGAGSAVQVDADVQVRGKLATLGLPVFNMKAADTLKQFAAALRTRLEGGATG